MGPTKLCRAALRRLHRFPEPAAPAYHGLPATPVTARSMPSALSDEHLKYIDYKLRQYQISEDESVQAPAQPLRKIAHKIKAKIMSIFHNNSERDQPDVFIPAWVASLPSMEELVAARREAVEMSEKDRRKMKLEVDITNIHAIFAEGGSGSQHSSLSSLEREEDLDDFKAFLRESATKAGPTVVDGTSIRTSQHGVICLEAPSLPDNKTTQAA